MVLVPIEVPDEVDAFFKETIGYDNSDYEWQVMAGLAMALDEYPHPFKAADKVRLAIDRYLVEIQDAEARISQLARIMEASA